MRSAGSSGSRWVKRPLRAKQSDRTWEAGEAARSECVRGVSAGSCACACGRACSMCPSASCVHLRQTIDVRVRFEQRPAQVTSSSKNKVTAKLNLLAEFDLFCLLPRTLDVAQSVTLTLPLSWPMLQLGGSKFLFPLRPPFLRTRTRRSLARPPCVRDCTRKGCVDCRSSSSCDAPAE